MTPPDPAAPAVQVRDAVRPPSVRGMVLRISLVLGLAELGFATVIPLLPLHLTERLGASVKLVGLVVATFALVETLAKTAWGSIADRVGRRPLIIIGLLLASIAPMVMSFLRIPALFVPLRLIDGSGSSALWPASAAAIADTSPVGQRATAMGTLNSFFLAGLALGPSAGLLVVGFTGSYKIGFYLASAILVSAAILAAVLLRGIDDVRHRPLPADTLVGYHVVGPDPHLSDVVKGARISPTLLAMLVVAFVQMFGVGVLAPILVIYAKRVIGLPEELIGTLFLVTVLAVAAASVPAGRIADRWGKVPAVVVGMVAATAGMWLLPLTSRLGLLGVAALLVGAGYALSSPAWHALVSELAPRGRVGLAMGAAQTAEGIGLVLGPLLGGVLWDEVSERAPFVATAIVLTVGTAILLVAIRRVAREVGALPRSH
ncbi:MAG TPA: MFS transporter [bacterium]